MCADDTCDETITVKVNIVDIIEEGVVRGVTVFCRKCKQTRRRGPASNVGGYRGRNYTGKSYERMHHERTPERLGVIIIEGEEARRFEALYKTPKQIRAEEVEFKPHHRDDFF